jgi:hypothetical protein
MKKYTISATLQKEPSMKEHESQRLFVWLDRAFLLIWLGFLAFVWMLVREVLDAPKALATLAPEQAACLQGLPQLSAFSQTGQIIFWAGFAFQIAIFALILALAHQVIHRCATGQVFVDKMISSLQRIGIIIAAFPVLDLVIQNLSAWAYVQTGDLIAFSGSYALDVTVVGVGLLLVTLAAAMQMAVQMHEDAALTI